MAPDEPTTIPKSFHVAVNRATTKKNQNVDGVEGGVGRDNESRKRNSTNGKKAT